MERCAREHCFRPRVLDGAVLANLYRTIYPWWAWRFSVAIRTGFLGSSRLLWIWRLRSSYMEVPIGLCRQTSCGTNVASR